MIDLDQLVGLLPKHPADARYSVCDSDILVLLGDFNSKNWAIRDKYILRFDENSDYACVLSNGGSVQRLFRYADPEFVDKLYKYVDKLIEKHVYSYH